MNIKLIIIAMGTLLLLILSSFFGSAMIQLDFPTNTPKALRIKHSNGWFELSYWNINPNETPAESPSILIERTNFLNDAFEWEDLSIQYANGWKCENIKFASSGDFSFGYRIGFPYWIIVLILTGASIIYIHSQRIRDKKIAECEGEGSKKKDTYTKKGDASLDEYVKEAFNELNKKENEHKWWPWCNCKTEATKLIDLAKEKEKDAKKKRTSHDNE